MKKRYRKYRHKEESENFWPAFTDMISTIALILFFLMLIAYVNNIVTGKNLEYAVKQLEDTQSKLEISKAEISNAEDQLRLLKNDLEKTAAEVKKGEIELKLSEEEIDKQKEIIASSNQELGQLRTKLKGIALLRLDVLNKVKVSIEENLGNKNAKGEELVLIGDNGNIIINEGLVFDYGKSIIKDEGKPLLAKLAKSFEKVLDDPNVSKNIDAINIQGHADIRGTADANRKLSTDRATSVVNYFMQSDPTLEKRYGKFFMASGFSYFRPLIDEKNEDAYSKNRRIEISVILKDSNVQNVIDDYLKESVDILNNTSDN
ncbi:OmpA family protein [Helicovermis profundi]|uniref:OmpA family protein n=1 Tax=Helicovermis profundi TaxID=3065157 RepID=A0AAU9EFM0_9FIRM|nr:OmpA family protein [Clostridia bacterium S502]